MKQIDAVRKHSPDFAASVDKIRESLSTSGLESLGVSSESHGDRTFDVLTSGATRESLSTGTQAGQSALLEAIILAKLRPAYLILNDKIEIDGEFDELARLTDNLDQLENLAKRAGRIDLAHHPRFPYAGTGWLIDKDIVVTNRHVAAAFAGKNGFGQYEFSRGRFGEQMEARIDYIRQHQSDNVERRRTDVLEVLYIAGNREPDIAFLRVAIADDLEPIALDSGTIEEGTLVAAVGYPAWDGDRNDPGLMDKLFKGIYNVKRFSPGYITKTDDDGITILTDYTSLGGNSGSVVLSLDSHKAVGLHFAGAFKDTNYAVASGVVLNALRGIKTLIQVPPLADANEATDPTAFSGRNGYDESFLGSHNFVVPLPTLGRWEADKAPVSDNVNGILNYRNFSVVQSMSRRLPLFTAVNIDGEKTFSLKRKGNWRTDGRLQPEHQIGNALYYKNPLDRGHLVRRKDPGWGESREIAQEAEIDTFHYTNSAPQHKDLNQRDWLGLEDYILESADTQNFKVCVFTGPVFRDSDKSLKNQPGAEGIKIPEEYWKVAVIVKEGTGHLSATGYVLSQGRMIGDLTEAAFVYGQYKTYQVKLTLIEKSTGLDFGTLKNADPLRSQPESVFNRGVIPLDGPESVNL